MNKKGFTLIELLAVIIILAILSLIVTPIVGNVIESARTASDLRSAEAYIKAGENYFAAATIDTSKAAKLGKVNVLDELEVSSRKATGKLYVEEDGSISMALLIRGKCYTKTASQSINEITVSDGENCGELPSVAFFETRIPNTGTYARESTITMPVPSGMSLYVKVNKAKEINSGTVSQKCNEDLSNCEDTTDTTLDANTWYKVGSSSIVIRTEENLTITTKQVNGRDTKVDEYKIENIDTAPSKPIISGGSATQTNEAVTLSITTESTASSGIEKYQYYVSTDATIPTGGTWTDMSGLSKEFDEEGEYYVFIKAISNVGLETVSDSQTVNIKYGPSIGDKFYIGTEGFYVIGLEDVDSDGVDEVKALAEWNLNVGYSCSAIGSSSCTKITNPTGKQDSSARGMTYSGSNPTFVSQIIGTVRFSSDSYWDIDSSYGDYFPAYVYDSNCNLKQYVDAYKSILEGLGTSIIEARIIKDEELTYLYNYYSHTTGRYLSNGYITSWAPSWLYQTSYWTGTASYSYIEYIASYGYLDTGHYSETPTSYNGVRPVIVVETSDL